MANHNNKHNIPDRSCHGITTSALTIGISPQDRSGTLAIAKYTCDIYINKDDGKEMNELTQLNMTSTVTTSWNIEC